MIAGQHGPTAAGYGAAIGCPRPPQQPQQRPHNEQFEKPIEHALQRRPQNASTVLSVPRDNGLPRARRYVGLIDVAPPIADQVLAALANASIAAYAQPYVGRDPYIALKPLKSPSERIWVDADKSDAARTTISTQLPALQADLLAAAAAQRDRDAMAAMQKSLIDDQFSDIAQRLAAEGLGQPQHTQDEPAVHYVEELEGYQPPVPPPLPRTDRLGRAAWLGVILGPLAALIGSVLDAAAWVAAAGLGAFAVGFVVLVARMPERRRQDDGWDDGAVV